MGQNTLSDDHLQLLVRIERDYLRGRFTVRPPFRGTERKPPPNPPNIVGILLDDLTNVGTADCAVLQLEDSDEVHAVKFLGNVTGGTFLLQLQQTQLAGGIETTTDIDADADAADVRAALEALPSINPGDVLVEDFPGMYLIRFTGQYAAESLPFNVLAGQAFTGQNVGIEIINEEWTDTGHVEKVRLGVPIVDAVSTPVKAGNQVSAKWVHTAGYCVDAVECRDIDVQALEATS